MTVREPVNSAMLWKTVSTFGASFEANYKTSKLFGGLGDTVKSESATITFPNNIYAYFLLEVEDFYSKVSYC